MTDSSNIERRKLWNVFVLGAGFLFVYTGYLTTASVSETILRSYLERTGMKVNGFISLGINNLANAVSAPFAPAVFRRLNRKVTMMLGGLLNAVYVFSFLSPSPILLYISAFLSGIGGTLIWISQDPDYENLSLKLLLI